ncbi:MAG: sugar ABC transporter substrate-binding protein [Alphaproteobacteria bacterium]|nr:sugar ABC transporter substrate-binding protein [Alphaproteobacteria bacterium]
MEWFEKRNPSIKLAVEKIPFNQIFQTIEVRLQARNADPDIFICDSPLTASYGARGHLMDLTPHLDASRFAKSALAAATHEGKIASAPFGSSMQVMFYNKALFREAGVAPPPADVAQRWTWEKTLEAARKLTDAAKGQWGYAFEQSERPYQLLPLGQSLGGVALSQDGFKASGFIDGPAFVEAYTWMQRLYTDWKVSPQGQFDPNIPVEMFGNGKVAMLVAGTFSVATLQQRFPSLDFGIAPMPYFEKGKPVTPTGAWHFAINPRTRNQSQTLTFLRDFMTEELHSLWFKLRPYPPVLKSIWDAEKATFDTDMWRIVRHELDNTAQPRPATPGFREYEDLVRVALRDIQTGADVKAALSGAAQRIDREMQKYR